VPKWAHASMSIAAGASAQADLPPPAPALRSVATLTLCLPTTGGDADAGSHRTGVQTMPTLRCSDHPRRWVQPRDLQGVQQGLLLEVRHSRLHARHHVQEMYGPSFPSHTRTRASTCTHTHASQPPSPPPPPPRISRPSVGALHGMWKHKVLMRRALTHHCSALHGMWKHKVLMRRALTHHCSAHRRRPLTINASAGSGCGGDYFDHRYQRRARVIMLVTTPIIATLVPLPINPDTQ
jgi:hypothetical protein